MSQGGVAQALAVPEERGTGLLLRKLVAGEQALAATAQIRWGLTVAQAPLAGIPSRCAAISGHQQGNDVKEAHGVKRDHCLGTPR